MKHLASTSRFAMLAVLFVQPAVAAPFCLQSQIIPPQCIYYDAQQCNREAARQDAVCGANPAELRLSPGPGKFCVVTSSRTSTCVYADRTTCTQEALRQNGTCTEAPPTTCVQKVGPIQDAAGLIQPAARQNGNCTEVPRTAAGVPDPYSPINGR